MVETYICGKVVLAYRPILTIESAKNLSVSNERPTAMQILLSFSLVLLISSYFILWISTGDQNAMWFLTASTTITIAYFLRLMNNALKNQEH